MQLTIQILQYEFLGPIKLSEWGPPMDRVVYIIFSKNKDVFNMIYVAESDKTEAGDFFKKNDHQPFFPQKMKTIKIKAKAAENFCRVRALQRK